MSANTTGTSCSLHKKFTMKLNKKHQKIALYIFVLPFIISFLVFFLYPIINTIIISF